MKNRGNQMKNAFRALTLIPLFAMNFLWAQEVVIPQIADGGGWKSTLVLTNTTAAAAVASLAFYKDTTEGNTETWTPTFLEGGSTADIPLLPGSTTFLHTPGTASTLTQGWAQVAATSGVVAYVIYTNTANGRASDATAPAVSPTGRILVPFDNTGGLVTAIAVVNPNTTAETISVNFRTSQGVSQGSLPSLPANGQLAFVMPTQFPGTADQAGLAEFYVSSGTLSIIALRANPTGGLTSAPVYFETGPPVISAGTGSSGGGSGGVPAGDITVAGFNITQTTTSVGVSNSVGGDIGAYTLSAWNAPYSGTKIGSCYTWDFSYSAGAKYPGAPDVFLDAGAKLTLSGPGLPAGTTVPAVSTSIGPAYSLQLPAGKSFVDGGTYTLGGNGGTQVEGFSAQATLPNSFAVTNWDSITSIDRSQPLTITWTGTGFENVGIGLVALTLNGTSVHEDVVSCLVAASLGTYSVPTAALSHLSAIAAGSAGGSLAVSTVPAVSAGPSTSTSLTPNLVVGGKVTYGSFVPMLSVEKSVPIQ
jgi:hypothetical protein